MGAGLITSIALSIVLITGMGFTLISMPGNLFILLVGIGYAWYDGFNHITFQTLYSLVALFIAGELVEFIAGALGAKKQKASTGAAFAAVVGAVLGGVIGTGVFPVVGSVLGAMGGAFCASYAAEYFKTKDADHARRVGLSVMKGQAVGMIFKLVVAIGMVALIITNLPWTI